jgi:hypothetical protein
MLTRQDISQGVYLRLNTSRLGKPAGLIGMVYAVGTDQAGKWYFQLRYLNTSPRTRASSQWSLNLHEEDLEHFDRIATGTVHTLLREPEPPKKPGTEDPTLASSLRGSAHPNQLRLFEYRIRPIGRTARRPFQF